MQERGSPELVASVDSICSSMLFSLWLHASDRTEPVLDLGSKILVS